MKPYNLKRIEKIKSVLKNQEYTLQNDRSNDYFSDNSNAKSVGLEDIDGAILTQLRQKFDLSVRQSGGKKQVPVIVDSPTSWAWAGRQDLKSVNDEIMYPLLTLKRGPIQRDNGRDRDPKNFFTPEPGVKYTARGQYNENKRYDAFAALTGEARPPDIVYRMRMPRYITVDYDCTLYTERMSSANNIVERVIYKSREYWGDRSEMMFYVDATGFNSNIESESDDRYVETTFSLSVNGYIIPEDSEGEPTTVKGTTIDRVEIAEKIQKFNRR